MATVAGILVFNDVAAWIPFAAASFVILAILASVPVSMAMGSYLLKYKEGDKAKQFGALAVGVLVYVIVGSLPLIGWLVKLILFVIGIGAIWIDSRSMIKKGIY